MSELVINSPLRQHFRPSPEVPNPSCCNVEGHLCDECRSKSNVMKARGHYSTNGSRGDYLPLPEPTVNVVAYDRRDDDVDYLPLPRTMETIILLNSMDSKRRDSPVSNHERNDVQRDDDGPLLPTPPLF